MTVKIERPLEFLLDSAGHMLDDRRVAIRFQEDRELITAKPGWGVAWPQAIAQSAANGAEQLVADHMAEAIIDHLESIQIEKQDMDATMIVLFGGANRLVKPIEKERAIGQPGQAVVERVMEQALLNLFSLRHIGDGADVTDHLAGFVLLRHRLTNDPGDDTVGPLHAKLGLE